MDLGKGKKIKVEKTSGYIKREGEGRWSRKVAAWSKLIEVYISIALSLYLWVSEFTVLSKVVLTAERKGKVAHRREMSPLTPTLLWRWWSTRKSRWSKNCSVVAMAYLELQSDQAIQWWRGPKFVQKSDHTSMPCSFLCWIPEIARTTIFIICFLSRSNIISWKRFPKHVTAVPQPSTMEEKDIRKNIKSIDQRVWCISFPFFLWGEGGVQESDHDQLIWHLHYHTKTQHHPYCLSINNLNVKMSWVIISLFPIDN